MSKRSQTILAARLIFAATAVVAASNAHGVILYKSAQQNTSAPTGALAGSGWQYTATFGGFTATAVAPHFFLTAQHIGGTNTFELNGTTYHVDATYNNNTGYVSQPGTDLRLWRVTETMSSYATLYNNAVDGSEIGKSMVVIGRGTARGEPVYGEVSSNNSPYDPTGGTGTQNTGNPTRGGELKGWLWGADTRLQSWGTNVVSAIVDGGSNFGPLVTYDFDADGSSDEGAVSVGDSGGPVFVKTNGGWKLAGVNLGADGAWRYSAPSSSDTGSPGTTPFNASLFDAGGLYIQADDQGHYQYIPESSMNIAGSSYSTSVSANLGWIQQYIDGPNASNIVPEPTSASVVAFGGIALLRRRRSTTSPA